MAITDMQMRQRDVAALDVKYTKELADAKAENDALRHVAAGRRRLWISKQSVSQCVKLFTASGVTLTSPRLADTAERDYFTLREADHYAKTTGRNPQKYINERRDRVAHIDGQIPCNYCEQYTMRFQREWRKCLQ